MAKATIITKSGTKITLEGTVKEVAHLTSHLVEGNTTSSGEKQHNVSRRVTSIKRVKEGSLVGLIGGLVDGDFFRKPRDLVSVKSALAALGHVYPVTSLSPVMLRLVRRRHLRRLKEKNRWLYTV